MLIANKLIRIYKGAVFIGCQAYVPIGTIFVVPAVPLV